MGGAESGDPRGHLATVGTSISQLIAVFST